MANRAVCGRGNPARAVFQAAQRSAEARRVATGVAVVCAAVWVGACAHAAPGLLTRHLIREGTPSIDFGGPSATSSEAATLNFNGPIPPIREVSRSSGEAVDIESTDVGLRAALTAVQAQPSLATHFAAAEEFRRLGIFDRAFGELQRSAQFDEHNAAVNDALARLWRDVGFPGLGLSNAYRAVYAAPRSATARHTLGTVLYAMDRHADAERCFREAVALDPLAWYAWQNLCQLSMTGGRTQEAIANCHQASALRSKSQKVRQP